jgi:hypothetical protein
MGMAEKIRKIGDFVDWCDEVSIFRYPPDSSNLPDAVIGQRN